MSTDRRQIEAQHNGRVLDLARENRELRAEVIRREAIIVAVREACRQHFDPDSRYWRVFAQALGCEP